MPRELIQLKTQRRIVRLLMIVFLLGAAVWSWFSVSWYIGNMLAEAIGAGAGNVELARTAVSLAPGDPLTHWRLAAVIQSTFPARLNEAIPEYERAVALSPHDYRFWTTLGIAYEQAGQIEKSEAALRRAVGLAPAYAQSHWYLGNLLLRNGRYDEAFMELRIASDANNELRPQFFTMLQEIYASDFNALSKAVGTASALRGMFALHLLKQKRYDDGLRLWSTLSAGAKVEHRTTAHEVISTLVAAHRYHDAVTVWNDIAPTPASRVTIGQMLDGSFEDLANYGPEMVFAWQVKNPPQVETSVDPSNANQGARSLRTVLRVRTRLTSLGATQLVPVFPNTQYELQFYRKSHKLESGSTPYIAVTSAIDNSVLGVSDGAQNGDTDWQRVAISFKTPANSEAVNINLMRGECLGMDTDLCPIFGTVWYDNFSLKPQK